MGAYCNPYISCGCGGGCLPLWFLEDSSSDWEDKDDLPHYQNANLVYSDLKVYRKVDGKLVVHTAEDMPPHCTRNDQYLPYALEPVDFQIGSNHQRVFVGDSLDTILMKKGEKEKAIPRKNRGTHEDRKQRKKELRKEKMSKKKDLESAKKEKRRIKYD